MQKFELTIDNRLFTLEVGEIDDRFQGEGIFQIVVLYVNNKELLNTTFGSETFLSNFFNRRFEVPFLNKLKNINELVEWLKFCLNPLLIQRSMKIENILNKIKN